ncbi:DsbA family protein [Halovenus sp. HT40]|uniref:DsbA family protein n=1 Tax=Halovenus sp. HT40 TaxID=3126691 RepID=UPI00300EC422
MSVTITEFTDPFCTWCWGAEPLLRRLEEVYGKQLHVEFVMGGLIADFDSFHDPANGITEPSDVAPHWEEAAARHGMPVDADVWHENPPQSSYPASIAFEAAEFQERDLANQYLRRLREAFATERRKIDERDVLLELAADVGLDTDKLETDIESDRAKAAFEEDRAYTRDLGVQTFPTFRISGNDTKQWLAGSQSFETVVSELEAVDPGLEQTAPRPLSEFIEQYTPVATREVAEVYELEDETAEKRLQELATDGVIERSRRGTGSLWKSVAN